VWRTVVVVLLAASAVYPLVGTPARLAQRMPGWRPPFGTLNALDYMNQGSYAWPDERNLVDLRHDAEAIRWLLDHVRGNIVIAETSEVDYYRAGSTRAASLTGLSGLRGMHVAEQRYGDQVAVRDGLHREFWSTLDPVRTLAIADELQIGLIYVSDLERYLHPDGVRKLEAMSANGDLTTVYRNDGVTIYAFPDRVEVGANGMLVPKIPVQDDDVG
jgi:uncharacterized membrane protein